MTANAFDLDSTTNTITYTLTSNPDSLFQIDANTGVITTAASINREVHGATRTVTVQATSSDGSTATQDFTIAINDIDEFDVTTPTDTDTTANEVNENTAIGTTVGVTSNAFDLDSTTNTITYTLTSNPDSLFQIDANTGVITTAASINREVHGATRTVTVQATSSDGSSATQDFTIAINDLDEFDVTVPTDTNVAANEVNENAAIGTQLALQRMHSTRTRLQNTITYTLTSIPDSLFQIDAKYRRYHHSRFYQPRSTRSNPHGHRSSHIQRRIDGNAGFYHCDQRHRRIRCNKTPTDTDTTANEVNENTAIGTTVGVYSECIRLGLDYKHDHLHADQHPDGLFQIDANTGVITTAAAINREVHGASRTVTVQATSSDGSSATQDFTIAINDLDEFDVTTPTDTDNTSQRSQRKRCHRNHSWRDFECIRLGLDHQHDHLHADQQPDGLFQIDANTGVITTAAAINREVHGATRTVTVQANPAMLVGNARFYHRDQRSR